MKTLSTPVTNEAAAELSGWGEVYDIYLRSSISTPVGTTNIIRLCNFPGPSNQFSFFAPAFAPEPLADRETAKTYYHWPLKREVIKGDTTNTNDKFAFAASGVSLEWFAMLDSVEWRDTPVVIRKVPMNTAGLTADDCVTLFTGAIDAARLTDGAIQFTCSNDLALLNQLAPRENMHSNCRFSWGDDFCTALRWKASPSHYQAETCVGGCTTTLVKTSGLALDTAANGSYGTDLINPLAGGAITASSEGAAHAGTGVTADLTTGNFYTASAHKLITNDPIQFAGAVAPAGITFGVTYYVIRVGSGGFKVKTSPTATDHVVFTTNGTAVTFSTVDSYAANAVRSSIAGYWRFSTDADWGTLSQAFYTIPSAQGGRKNPELKPYIQFDLGSTKKLRTMRIASVAGPRPESLIRLVELFSSADASVWRFESYFEIPPIGDTLYDWLDPESVGGRYWRICVRSRWGVALEYPMIQEFQAYEEIRNWWAGGFITFDAATATAALRNVRRPVLQSYAGEVVVPTLPATPAAGDTMTIQRGCPRTLNACFERRNSENFGGFSDLPNQQIIRG